MTPLVICAIVGLIVDKKIRKQRKIDRLIERIREREEDSGNESEGDTDELAKLVEMGDFDPWVGDNL
uniref:Protein Vpu n=1 Tax=Human immunodeficiency virus type 1 TaxID=11676 RepID=Q4QX48_HV1|nr:vpu protein [Human immunodeficiency virus 1]